jgi:hypothetical protein
MKSPLMIDVEQAHFRSIAKSPDIGSIGIRCV